MVDFPHLALTIARTYIFNFHSKTTIVVHKHKSQGLWKPKGSRREIDFIALLYSKSGLLKNLIYNYFVFNTFISAMINILISKRNILKNLLGFIHNGEEESSETEKESYFLSIMNLL